MLIPRFASGVPSTDIGFQKFAGRFMDIGMRVGMLIRQGYALMFSTCSKTSRANSTRQPRRELILRRAGRQRPGVAALNVICACALLSFHRLSEHEARVFY